MIKVVLYQRQNKCKMEMFSIAFYFSSHRWTSINYRPWFSCSCFATEGMKWCWYFSCWPWWGWKMYNDCRSMGCTEMIHYHFIFTKKIGSFYLPRHDSLDNKNLLPLSVDQSSIYLRVPTMWRGQYRPRQVANINLFILTSW